MLVIDKEVGDRRAHVVLITHRIQDGSITHAKGRPLTCLDSMSLLSLVDLF